MTSEANAGHLLAAEDLIQKHSLMESQISSVGETIQRLNKQANQFIAAGHKETPALQKRLQMLNDEYKQYVTRTPGSRGMGVAAGEGWGPGEEG